MALARSANWVRRVNEELDDKELDAVRLVIPAWQSFGREKLGGVDRPSLDLESTLRARGRRKKKAHNQAINERKESNPLFVRT